MKQYQHLSSEERFYMHQAVREGKKKAEIARALERSPSTIGREMRRNMWPSAHLYTYDWAMYFARQRKRRVIACKYRKLTDEIKPLIVALLKRCLSPEQISAYLSRHQRILLSHESIYRFIRAADRAGGSLRCYLRQGHKKRRRRYGSGARVSRIPNRTPIEARPAIVRRKTRLGDWECDTLVGSDRKSALVSVVDRASLFTLCAKISHKTADSVQRSIVELLRSVSDKVETGLDPLSRTGCRLILSRLLSDVSPFEVDR
jgi:IS30 family transposase